MEGRVRRICLGLPEVTEKVSHGSPAFFVKKQFVMLWAGGHHDHHFPHLWCSAPPGAQEALIRGDPKRYFRPPYVGGRGWVGLRLDHPIDEEELAGLIEDAYCTVAPSRLTAELGR
ncbi:MAG: MmcQ/YjbR family DNA-binding protein [Acidimicrobiales bacterium]